VGIPIEGEEENWECPTLFRLGGRWVIVYSPHAPVKYYTGHMDFEQCRFEPQTKGQFDFGRFIGLYAATVMPDPKGRMVLWAWMYSKNKGRGWNGCLALPRVLTLLPDGRIGQTPAPEFEMLRQDSQSCDQVSIRNGVRHHTVPGGCAELWMTIQAAERFGVRFSDRTGMAVELVYTKDGLSLAGDTVPASELSGTPPRELRVFVDRSLIEVFIDGRITLSRWIEAHEIVALDVFAEQGWVQCGHITLWRMGHAEFARTPVDKG
jgi:beta-fructofuranosidase